MYKLFKKTIVFLLIIASIVALFFCMINNKISVYEISSNENIVYEDVKTIDSIDDVYCAYAQRTSVLKGYTNIAFRSFNNNIALNSGRLPQRADEIVIGKQLAKDFDYELGDKLTIDETLYKVVGIDNENDFSYYVCCLPECFNKIVPEKIVVKIKGKHSIENILDSVLTDLKVKRENDLVKISDEQIKQLANKYNFYNDNANKTIEEYESQLKTAEELLFNNQIQINNYRQILNNTRGSLQLSTPR